MKARVLALLSATTLVACFPADWGASAILHPWRRPLATTPSMEHESVTVAGEGASIRGWLFRARPPARGLIVYLHGVADNRSSGIGVAQRYVPMGFDVLTYDSRAHGESGGENCTYGYYEKDDLRRALDAVGAKRAILLGSSLGAAVALQAAADDPRVVAVIAQSSFADLASIVLERKPFFATTAEAEAALALAERRAAFRAADVSPALSASRIRIPVLVIHGAADRETRPSHSERIHAALGGPKRLMLVPGAGHNDVLAREDVWRAITAWIEAAAK